MSHPAQADSAAQYLAAFHADEIAEVQKAVKNDHVVVVGMGWNPHVGTARKALDAAGITYTYLGYGNYISKWKVRLAIKMWSQWPTFPQVFVDGSLIGGADLCKAAIADGTLKNA
jgi:glutaredoxin-related protein